jgi:hypothetical protein
MVVGALAAAVAALAAQDAGAATTVGSTFAPNSGCTSGDTYIQEAVASGPGYAAPMAGVITSWSFQAGSTGPTLLKLKAARDAGGGNWTIVGESTGQAPPANVLSTYPTRISVQAGDVIGYYIVGAVPCKFSTGNPGDMYGITGGDPAPGMTASFLANPTVQLDISARLERDADGDGFGDETQDQCFTDPSTQGPCPAPTVAGTAQIGQTLTGTPTGTPVSPSYQWLDCDAGGANCAAIAGATGTSYVVGESDANHTLRFRKTATDASGTQTTDSAPTAIVPGPPPGGLLPAPAPSPGPPPRPTCEFSLTRATARGSDGSIDVVLRLPGRGALELLGTEDNPRAWIARLRPGRDRFAYGRRGRTVVGAGRVKLRLVPNAKGRLVLRRHGRRGWALHVRLWATFTPVGGRTCTRVRRARVLRAGRPGR